MPLPGLHRLAEGLTLIGRQPVSSVIPALAILALWVAGRGRVAGLLAVAALARVLSGVIKDLVERPRPPASLVDVSQSLGDPSFPSGHVLGAALFYGFLYCVAADLFPQPVLRRTVRAACAAVVVLMGVARMEMGAHWPSDVLGGYLVATLVLAPLVCLHRRGARTAISSA